MTVNTAVLVPVISSLVVDVTRTRNWADATSGTVHGWLPSLAVLAMIWYHVLPLVGLYSILTSSPGLPLLVHVMLCEVPCSHFSPPFGDVTVKEP